MGASKCAASATMCGSSQTTAKTAALLSIQVTALGALFAILETVVRITWIGRSTSESGCREAAEVMKAPRPGAGRAVVEYELLCTIMQRGQRCDSQ